MNSEFMDFLIQLQKKNVDIYVLLSGAITKVKIIAINGDWVLLKATIGGNNVDLNLHYSAVIPVTSA